MRWKWFVNKKIKIWLKILKLLKIQKREQKVQIFQNVRQETWKNNCGNSGEHAAGPDERADMITFYGQEFSELKTPYNIVVAADVLEFVQGLTEWISYIMMLKYGGTSIGNESVTEPSRARADEKRRAEWLKPVRRHIIL